MASARRTTLHHHVADAVGTEIAHFTIPAGAVLSVESLEQRFSVSRSVTRDAFRELSVCGMIESRPRIGTVVQDVTHWDLLNPQVIMWRSSGPDRVDQLRDLTVIREAIEPLAAQLAAAHASSSDIAQLAQAIDEMTHAAAQRDVSRMQLADTAFHSTIFKATTNLPLQRLNTTFEAVMFTRYTSDVPAISDATPPSLERHRQLYEAIASRNELDAHRIARDIVNEFSSELTSTHTPASHS